jgi:hypothetical protein
MQRLGKRVSVEMDSWKPTRYRVRMINKHFHGYGNEKYSTLLPNVNQYYFTVTLKCNICVRMVSPPITVAAQSKACTVFDRSKAGIMGSNSTLGMDVCDVYSVFVLFCV